MIKRICIFFFSGTGMTKHIVSGFSNEAKLQGILTDCFKIESLRKLPDLSNYDMLGIAYPVHSFNAPQIVIDFVKRLHRTNGMNTFILHSAGENHFINYASSALLIRKLKMKGCRVFYNRLIEMPSNFAVKHTDEEVRLIMNRADKNIPKIARNIILLRPFFMKENFISKIVSVLGRVEWLGAHVIGKFFYVNSACNRCGKCLKNCPVHNIKSKTALPYAKRRSIKNEHGVKFNWHCILCMRCVYSCPNMAVNIHQPFSFIRFDSWYDFFKGRDVK